MHSRIYQVSEQPISQDKLKDEETYAESFVGSLADYVAKSENYSSDLEWLKRAKEGIEVDTEKATIIIRDKKKYFSKKHEEFKQILEKNL